MNQSENIKLMLQAAYEAAAFIKKDYYAISELQIQKKGLKDFVTKTDLKAEEILVSYLKKARPSYAFLSEESGEIKNNKLEECEFRWIIDPIDGTFNFIHNNPNFAISIALEHNSPHKNEIVCSLIYLPITQEIFWAEKNKGAYYIDSRGVQSKINVSNRVEFEELSVIINFLEKVDTKQKEQFLSHLIKNHCQVRISGSAVIDLAYLASGKHDLLIQANLHPWDIAAGLLLIQEAGVQATNFEGSVLKLSDKNIIAANKELIDQLRNLETHP